MTRQPVAFSTIHDLLAAALNCEDIFLATVVYWCVQEGRLQLTDAGDRLDTVVLTEEEKETVRQWMRSDVLGLRKVKLYAFPCREGSYALVFARDVEQAARLFEAIYRFHPERAFDVYDRLKCRMYIVHGRVQTIQEVKHGLLELPYYFGEVEGREGAD
ncbi:MAG: hypothetical protein ACI33P_15510 [Lysinibacillus sp.]